MNVREVSIGGLMLVALLAASETRARSFVSGSAADPVVPAPCNEATGTIIPLQETNQ